MYDREGATGNFSKLPLNRFFSPGFGLVMEVPESWKDASDEDFFELIEPATGATITASARANSGLSPQEWADTRLAAVTENMPEFNLVRGAYPFKGATGEAIAAEYRGAIPGQSAETYLWIVCIHRDDKLISVSFTADTAVFAQNESLYRWLIQEKLTIYNVVRTSV